jgi:nucleoid DNA-binding protein
MAKKTTRKSTTKRAAAPRAKKAPAKRAAKKTAPARSAVAKPASIKPADKPRTKSEVYGTIAEQCGLQRKQVAQVFDTLGTILASDLGKRGPGVVNVGGLLKVKVRTRPARKAGKAKNPFTGEMMSVAARPAQRVPKVTALKALKELV